MARVGDHLQDLRTRLDSEAALSQVRSGGPPTLLVASIDIYLSAALGKLKLLSSAE